MKTHKLPNIVFYKHLKETKFTTHKLRLSLYFSMETRENLCKEKFESTIF